MEPLCSALRGRGPRPRAPRRSGRAVVGTSSMGLRTRERSLSASLRRIVLAALAASAGGAAGGACHASSSEPGDDSDDAGAIDAPLADAPIADAASGDAGP